MYHYELAAELRKLLAFVERHRVDAYAVKVNPPGLQVDKPEFCRLAQHNTANRETCDNYDHFTITFDGIFLVCCEDNDQSLGIATQVYVTATGFERVRETATA